MIYYSKKFVVMQEIFKDRKSGMYEVVLRCNIIYTLDSVKVIPHLTTGVPNLSIALLFS